MRWFLILIIFILLASFFIISNNNLHFNRTDDTIKFVSHYYEWLGNLVTNAKEVTAYAIKFDWLPANNKTG